MKSSTGAAPAPGLSPHQEEEKKGNEVGSFDEHNGITQEQDKHHHSIDKSICGGGVILGGLATTFFVAIGCYIRVTRRKYSKPSAPTLWFHLYFTSYLPMYYNPFWQKIVKKLVLLKSDYAFLKQTRTKRSSEEEFDQKLGYILEKSNFHQREANKRLS